MTNSQSVTVNHKETHLYLEYFLPIETKQPRPAVMIFHPWAGRDAFCLKKAKLMAEKGYIGIAVDLYGEARLGQTTEECMALMGPLSQDRVLLQDRLAHVFKAIQSDSRIDVKNLVAMGFCFGGLCVLDAVRNNIGLKAAISIHGLYGKPSYELPKTYEAKVLALSGYCDPMVPPEQIHAFEDELHETCQDWQLMVFGKGKHAFTNPLAHDESMGTVYDPLLDARTTGIVDGFLGEVLG